MRTSSISRKTKETAITVAIHLDQAAPVHIQSGIGFFDHMLELFAKHGRFGLMLECKGDLQIDNHHSVEDMGIVLGQAVKEALGDKKGIVRYAAAFTPMDEALSRVVIDLSGRGYLVYDVSLSVEKIGDFETETLKEFLQAFAVQSGMNLHVQVEYGENGHHIIESIFKGLGRALYQASRIDTTIDGCLSTKGIL